MSELEILLSAACVRGILPDATVSIVSVQWHGSDALTMIYRDPSGRVAEEILYRSDEPRLEVIDHGRPRSFEGDGATFRLVSLAHATRPSHEFDPVSHTSVGEKTYRFDRTPFEGRCRDGVYRFHGTERVRPWRKTLIQFDARLFSSARRPKRVSLTSRSGARHK